MLLRASAGLPPSRRSADSPTRLQARMSTRCSVPYRPARWEIAATPSRMDPSPDSPLPAPTLAPISCNWILRTRPQPRPDPDRLRLPESAPPVHPDTTRWARLTRPYRSVAPARTLLVLHARLPEAQIPPRRPQKQPTKATHQRTPIAISKSSSVSALVADTQTRGRDGSTSGRGYCPKPYHHSIERESFIWIAGADSRFTVQTFFEDSRLELPTESSKHRHSEQSEEPAFPHGCPRLGVGAWVLGSALQLAFLSRSE